MFDQVKLSTSRTLSGGQNSSAVELFNLFFFSLIKYLLSGKIIQCLCGADSQKMYGFHLKKLKEIFQGKKKIVTHRSSGVKQVYFNNYCFIQS